jgi:hypothetical protein
VNARPRPLGGPQLARLGLVAAALHAAFDAASASWAPTTPPYLRTADMPEAFQALSPVTVSVAASCVSGVIAVIALLATEHARRRGAALAVAITGFWLLSAALMRLVWLDTPWSTTAAGLLAGLPRGVVIGAVLDALARAPERAAARSRSS